MRFSAATLVVLIVFVLALIIGAVALKDYLQEEPVAAAPPPLEYAIAMGDLPPGRIITRSDIGFITEPALKRMLVREAEAASADGTFSSPYLRERLDAEGNPVLENGKPVYDLALPRDTIPSETFLMGRRVKSNIAAGVPFQASSLYPEGYRPALTTEVTDGRGIVTVPISNFIPQDQDITNLKADVLFRNRARLEEPGFEPIPEQTVVLVRDARILEAGQPYAPTSTSGASESGGSGNPERILTDVTLAVSLDDSAKLMTAQNNGDLSLVLYNPSSDQGSAVSSIDDPEPPVKLTDIVQATPIPAPEIEIKPYDTTIFRGTGGFTNNSFSFSDLLRELAEVGAIQINMPKTDDDLAANPASFTVPLNQPSNSGSRGTVAGGGGAVGGQDTVGGTSLPQDGPGVGRSTSNAGSGGG